jgi:hypothetical protein
MISQGYQLKVSIAILVFTIQVAGPWSCCCLYTAIRSLETSISCSISPEHDSCCSEHPALPAESHQPDCPKPCPCNGYVAEILLPPPIERVELDFLVLCFQAHEHTAFSCDVLDTSRLDSSLFEQSVMEPFLTTEARLYCHHVLHC